MPSLLLRKFQQSFAAIAFIIVLQFLSNAATGQSVIYYQNFGTTSTTTLPTGWTASGAAAANISLNTSSASSGYTLASGTAASGTANLADGAVGTPVTGSAVVVVSGVISTVGFTGITVQYAARATSTYAAVPTFEWSSDGATWNSIAYTPIPTTSTYTLVNATPIALPSGAAGQSNLQFRFTFTRTATTGNYRIDDFSVSGTGSTTDYFSAATGNLDVTTTWGTNPDGTGTHPANFTVGLQNFHISNGTAGTLGANWTVSGTSSKIIADGTDFTVPSTQTVTATIDVNAGRTLTLANATLPVIGILNVTSTVKFSGLTGVTVPVSSPYGNVIFDNTTVALPGSISSLTFAGNFTLQNGASFAGANSTLGYSLVTTGTANQTINSNGATLTVWNLDAGNTNAKATGTLALASGTNMTMNNSIIMILSGGVSNQFSDGGNTLSILNNLDLSGTAASYNFSGTVALNSTGSGSCNIRGGSTAPNPCVAAVNNLTLNNTIGVKINPAAGGATFTVKGNLTVASTATVALNYQGNTLAVAGNIAYNPTTDLITAGSSVLLNGTGTQTYSSNVTAGNTIVNLTINKGESGVTLNAPLNVSGTLTLTSGIVTTGTNTLTITPAGAVSGGNAASYVNGNYTKTIPTGTGVTATYESGDATYSPVTLTFPGTVSTSGTVTLKSTAGNHPNISTSFINTSNFVNRYWTITNTGVALSAGAVNVSLSYNAGDIAGGGSNTGYIIRQYAASAWTTAPSVTNTTTAVSPLLADASITTGVSATAFSGDYIAGAACSLPAITGTQVVCTDATTTLSNATTGGAWSSSNGALATVGSTGIVTGVAIGTPTITYTLGTGGCTATATVTVNPLPATPSSITGTFTVCAGAATTALAEVTTSGAWSSTNTAAATVGSTGTVTGVASGTSIISYTVTNSCGSAAATTIVTVNPLPAAPASITGTLNVCAGGATTALAEVTTSGAWSSTNTAAATVGSTGTVTGVASGTSTISYTVTNSCGSAAATTIVTVNGIPAAGTITGTATVNTGSTTALADAITGGAWSSITAAVATVGSTGIVTGVVTGTTTISYTVTSSCGTAAATINVTVTAPPLAGWDVSTNTVATFGPSPFTATVQNSNVTVVGLTRGAGVSTSGTPAARAWGGVNWQSTSEATAIAATSYVTFAITANSGFGTSISNLSLSYRRSGTGPSNGELQYATDGVTFIDAAALSYTNTTSGGATIGPIDLSGITALQNVPSSTTITFRIVNWGGTSTSGTWYVFDVAGSAAPDLVVMGTATPQCPAIAGTATVCAGGATTILSDATTGGTWSSGNTAVATIDPALGIVTGVAGGTATISYAASCGVTTTIVTVNPLPAPASITGTLTVCSLATATLTDATTGGTWSSSSATTATVGSTGIVTGAAAGTATISYTVTNGCGSTSVTAIVTVNPLANAGTITGPATASTGGTITLTDAATGGVWSSANTAIATVGSTGIVTGITAGTAIISYTATNGCGAAATATVITVSAPPAVIYLNGFEGIALVSPNCTGGATGNPNLGIAASNWNLAVSSGSPNLVTFTGNAPTAGTALAISTATPTTQTFTLTIPVNSGFTANITGLQFDYRATSTSYPAIAITINGTPVYTNTALSVTSAFFTVPVTGLSVTGITGNITMTVVLSGGSHGASGTFRFDNVSLSGNVNPIPAPVIGTDPVSVTIPAATGTSFTVGGVIGAASYQWQRNTSGLTGGTWVNISSATMDATGLYSGFTTASTASSNTLTLTNVPVSWNGFAYRCVVTNAGGSTTSGAALLNVTSGTSCSGTPPAGTAVPVATAFCGSGSTTVALTDGASATGITYQWISSSTGVAGSYTNIAGATSTVYITPTITTTTFYACITTCTAFSLSDTSSAGTVTINALPSFTITPAGGNVCSAGTGLSMTAAGPAATYTWSPGTGLSATTGATVIANPTGNVVYSVAATSATTCVATNTVSVTYNVTPGAITMTPASLNTCVGGTPNLLTASLGAAGPQTVSSGTISVDASAAHAVGTSGLAVTEIPAGATITSASVTVNFSSTFVSDDIINLVAPNGNIINLINQEGAHGAGSYTGAVISSSGVATLASAGAVTPITGTFAADAVNAAGPAGFVSNTATWPGLYSVPDGTWTLVAYNSTTFADNPTTLTSWSITINYSLPPITWSPVTNLFTDAAGTIPYTGTAANTVYENPVSASTITYAAAATNGACTSAGNVTVTVNPVPTAPAAITGTTVVCAGGATTALNDVTTGGTWSSNNTGVATTGSTGIVTGVTSGTATISYTISNTCGTTAAVTIVTVNPLPAASAAITGTLTVCAGGATTTLNDVTTGGVWSSGVTSVATVGTTGIVTGVSSGTATISYTRTNGCGSTSATAFVTVNPLPATPPAISGTATVCPLAITTLSDATTGGTWTSVSTAIATVGSTGTVTGVAFGTSTISYTIINGCGSASVTGIVTVNALPAVPAVITGTASVCAGGATTALSDATSGGVWSSANTATATVGSTGIVTGIAANTAIISYTVTNGCGAASATATVTVNLLATPGAITGISSVCIGSVTTLSNVTSGGTWSSVNTAAATVGTAGIVTGVSLGTSTISYTVANSCGSVAATAIVTVNSLPAAITGTEVICAGSATTLSNSTTGGSWSSGSAGIATVGSGSGIVTGISGGTGVIMYALPTGCTAIAQVTVNPVPFGFAVTGGGGYCTGSAGPHVGLSGSAPGISYQLINGLLAVGGPKPGTGAAIDFGVQTATGTYTVQATDTLTLCTNVMSGSTTVSVNPSPAVFTMTGGGSYCSGTAGVHVGINGSNTGVSYQLFNGFGAVGSAVAGTGFPVDLGAQTAAGTYGAVAVNVATSCSSTMFGSSTVTVLPLPTAYAVIGGGGYCPGTSGVTVSLSSSAIGINYQLFVNGTTPVGTAVLGTGAGINFGLQTTAGTYTVVATSATTGCTSTMSGSAVVLVNPAPAPFNVTGGGQYCTGSASTALVGLSGSVSGTSYQLTVGGVNTGAPVAGTGLPISFGIQSTAGVYNVVATITSTSCAATMSGTATIIVNPLPTVFTVTGGGGYCAGNTTGVSVGLNGSTIGISYQLFYTPTGGVTSALGSPVPGTGVAITFAGGAGTGGTYVGLGSYSVVASTTTALPPCTSNMFGSVSVFTNPLPNPISLTGGGGYCVGTTGVPVGLGGSVVGTNYQLFDGLTLVSAASGTGGTINFGLQTLAGTYTVVATTPATTCTATMPGSVTVTPNALPLVYNVSLPGAGSYCAGVTATGVTVSLSGSNTLINYQLYNTGVAVPAPAGIIAGTGSALSFTNLAAGSYTILATNSTTSCAANMTGSVAVSVNPVPTVYAVTGGGNFCTGGTGVLVGLSSTNTGINYTLLRGTAITSLPGVGGAISYGLETVPGTYRILATNPATTCADTMSGSAVVSINSLPVSTYTLSAPNAGAYCAGGAGVVISTSSSDAGISYQLMNGGVPAGSPVSGIAGTAVSFAPQTAAGTYTVVASNTTTTCSSNLTGSVTVTILPLPTVFSVTGGGPYCSSTTGAPIGLSGSTSSVSYQLMSGGAVGAPVAGSGSAITFGLIPSGTYTVVANNPLTGCSATMSGTATSVQNLVPAAYTTSGGGSYCTGGTGVAITLSNSSPGVSYQLTSSTGAPVGGALSGTGVGLTFPNITANGAYTVVATNTTTACTATMTGVVTVSATALPTAHTVTGGGNYCPGTSGSVVSLNGSATGTNYQLFNGSTATGAAVAGTGSPISFGPQTGTGTYTIVANTPATTCSSNMTGSVTVGISTLPVSYNVTGGGNYCPGGAGVLVGTSGSNTGVTYQLFNGAGPLGTPMPGTGFSLSFGLITASGTYTVMATGGTTGCTSNMTGTATVVVSTPPTAFNVTGGGNYCMSGTGVHVGLDGSVAGTEYQLYNTGGVPTGSPVAGTGSLLDFGAQTAAGTYTVIATSGSTTCTNTMSGSTTINILPLPTVYTVSMGNSYCAGGSGIDITLSRSDAGVNYQLLNGTTPEGAPVAGTGTGLDFGNQTAAGTYTIVGSNAGTGGCSSTMSGSSVIVVNALPTAYTVSGGGNYCAGGTGVHVTLSGSNTGIRYQLWNGGVATGGTVPGTGSALDFGLQTGAGTYTVTAANTATGCSNTMTGSTAVTVNTLPAAFTVTASASNYCAGGDGVDIQLNGSESGTRYQLYNGSVTTGAPVAGTGFDIDFGLQTAAGLYTVVAMDPSTTCNSNMTGAAAIVIDPLPIAYTVVGGGNYCAGSTGAHVGISGSNTGISYQLYNGGALSGPAVMGTGLAIDFGMQTAGSYTVIATNAGTTCTNAMSGSATVAIAALPTVNTVTGGGNYCAGAAGVHVGLNASTAGVNYQLYNGGALSGTPVAGTGIAIDFGLQVLAGDYTVMAINAATTCSSTMAGSAVVGVNSLPAAYAINGGGNYCPGGAGVLVGLGGSNTGISYQLYNGTAPAGSAVSGTGSAISFGSVTAAGTYTIVANNTTTSCTSDMSGTVSVGLNPLPSVFTVIGGGNYCATGAGVHVGVNGSSTGVNYQLFNGGMATGFPVAGSGGPLDFGLQTAAGTYTVVASNGATTCSSNMSGSATIVVNPLVSPSVNLSTGVGDTICSGHSVTLSTTTANGGTTPAFSWSVNGSPVSSGSSYSYMPANGDVVTVSMTSSATCATPPTVGTSVTLTVMESGNPNVAIAAIPGQTVCQGTMVTFNNASTFGGTPSFTWIVNGVNASTAPSYSYLPANGDVVYVIMNSNYRCRLENTVSSNHITMEVDDSLLPVVTIAAFPGVNISKGESLTLTASVVNGGTAPTYQWFLNGLAIPGANQPSYTASTYNSGDSVTCEVISSGGCSGLSGFNSVRIVVGTTGVQQVTSAGSDIKLLPNPNSGTFSIKGTLGTTEDEEVSVEISDMLGQVIYRNTVMAHGGNIDQKIQLNGALANGMYILNLRSASANNVFHVVIEQ